MEEVVCDVHDLMTHNISMKLTGNVSRLVYAQNKSKSNLDAAINTLNTFQTVDGSEEFWAMVRILNGEGPP